MELLLHDLCLLNLIRNYQVVSQHGCTDFHSHLQCMGVVVSPYPCQNLLQLHQALWMCPFEAVWVVVKSMDSGVRQPGFLTRLHPSTSCVTLADFPNHSVPQLSHLLNGNNINNNCLILLRLLCIYHNACHIAVIPQMLVRTVIPSGCQEVFK